MRDLSVSVVVPTRDRRRLLRRALDSLRRQTVAPLEVLVVDDGSRDGTGAMLRHDYPEVRLVTQEPAGVSAARNHGIRRARGSWIGLLDSDDEWMPEKLERQLAALRDDPDARICHTDEIWIRNGMRVNPKARHAKHGGWIYERCLPLCCISPSSVLLDRRVLDVVGGFDESLPACEDYDLWLRIACRYRVLLVDDKLVVKHGGHDDQLSRRHWGMDRFRVRALEKAVATAPLSSSQRETTRRMLRRKARILRDGAVKRGHHQRAAAYGAMLRRYAGDPRGDGIGG